MRYLVTARVKPGRQRPLCRAIEDRSLGEGSVAGGEYLRNMAEARLRPNGRVQWVEVCYCPTPLGEERPFWQEHFDLLRVQDAHHRSKCRDENGAEPWGLLRLRLHRPPGGAHGEPGVHLPGAARGQPGLSPFLRSGRRGSRAASMPEWSAPHKTLARGAIP